jgi:hypothetical protein
MLTDHPGWVNWAANIDKAAQPESHVKSAATLDAVKTVSPEPVTPKVAPQHRVRSADRPSRPFSTQPDQ